MTGDQQLELGANRKARRTKAKAPDANRLVEYQEPLFRELWRVERWDLLVAEFGLTVEQLPAFHGVLATLDGPSARGWLVTRRLFGLLPVLPAPGANPDDLRVFSREELASALGISKSQLQQELDGVRIWWQQSSGSAPGRTVSEPVRETLLTEDELLREHGFPDDYFEVHGRSQEVNRAERNWFGKRVREWQKPLSHPMAGEIARRALLNELKLRRGETALLRINRGSNEGEREFERMQEAQEGLERIYQEQLVQLDKIFPWMGAVAGQQSMTGTLSDLVRGYQTYGASGDTALVDGMNTALEIQVLLRQSVQMPEAQYRLGLVAFAKAARAGLWNPNWRPSFTPSQFRKLDEGFREAISRASEELGETKPDLAADGPEGEYADLHVAGVV